MAKSRSTPQEASFFSLPKARWVVGVLSMLIAVVGRRSLLGLILRQARSEITSIVQHEQPPASPAKAACYKNN